MTRLFGAFGRAFIQLGDPAIWRILVKSMAITLAIFVLGGIVVWQLARGFLLHQNLVAAQEISLIFGIVLGGFAAWLLFRLVSLAVIQFFADDVVLAVERRYYPDAIQTARKIPLKEELCRSVAGFARALLGNVLALPVALVLTGTAIGPAVVFWAVNAWLLGRELQDMAWARHAHDGRQNNPLHGGTRFLLGGITATLLMIPFANLLAPVIGAASATHLVQNKIGDNHAA
ncbi:MAG: EI24 domain-containing protein [Sphingomonadaceae bacterium]